MKTIWKKIMLFSGVGASSISAIAPIVSCSALKINNGNSETIDDSMIESAYLRFPGMESDLSGERDNLGLYTSSVLSKSYLGNLLNMQKTQIERTQLKEWNDWVYNFKIPYKNNPNKFGRIAYPNVSILNYIFLNIDNLYDVVEQLINKAFFALINFFGNTSLFIINDLWASIPKIIKWYKDNPNSQMPTYSVDNNIKSEFDDDNLYNNLKQNATCNPEETNFLNLDFENVDFGNIRFSKISNIFSNPKYSSILFLSDILNLSTGYSFAKYLFLHSLNKMIYINGYKTIKEDNDDFYDQNKVAFINIKRSEFENAINQIFIGNFLPLIKHFFKVFVQSVPMLLEIISLTDVYNRLERWVDTFKIEIDNQPVYVLYPTFKYVSTLLNNAKSVMTSWLRTSLTWISESITIKGISRFILGSLADKLTPIGITTETALVQYLVDHYNKDNNLTITQIDSLVSFLLNDFTIDVNCFDFLPLYDLVSYIILLIFGQITVNGKSIDSFLFNLLDCIIFGV